MPALFTAHLVSRPPVQGLPTFSVTLNSKDFDEYGRCPVADGHAMQVVTSGYGGRSAYITVDGHRRRGDVAFGRYSSWVTVPALAVKEYPSLSNPPAGRYSKEA